MWGYFPLIPHLLIQNWCFGPRLAGVWGFSVTARLLAHWAIASSEAASSNCFFLTHTWRFMHSSLFCWVWTDVHCNEVEAGETPHHHRHHHQPCPIDSQERCILWPVESLLMSTYRGTVGGPLPFAGWSPILLKSLDGTTHLSAGICLNWAAMVDSD